MGEYNAPEHTETLIYFMYAMTAICVLVTVVGALAKFVAGIKDDPKGAVKSLVALALFAGVIAVAYGMASEEPLTMASGDVINDVTVLKLTDTIIYVCYFLLTITGVATLVNLSGIFKR